MMISIIIFILIALLLSILGAYLYYLGGQGGAWYKNTKMRDWGCNLCVVLILILKGLFFNMTFTSLLSGSLVLTFFVQWSTLSTYWKKHAPDVLWYHWFMTGFMWGMSPIFYILVTKHWIFFSIRTIFLALFTMYWSEKQNNVFKEDMGKSFAFVSTMSLL